MHRKSTLRVRRRRSGATTALKRTQMCRSRGADVGAAAGAEVRARASRAAHRGRLEELMRGPRRRVLRLLVELIVQKQAGHFFVQPTLVRVGRASVTKTEDDLRTGLIRDVVDGESFFVKAETDLSASVSGIGSTVHDALCICMLKKNKVRGYCFKYRGQNGERVH